MREKFEEWCASGAETKAAEDAYDERNGGLSELAYAWTVWQAATAASAARIAELEKAVAFAACTIKSGERWTDRCQEMLFGPTTPPEAP